MFKKISLSFISFILIVVALIGCYFEYICIQYYRIEDNAKLNVREGSELDIDLSKTYKLTTYNIGFGAYNHDFSFFMDDGYMKDGSYVKGEYSKARSKEIVNTNTNGAISVLKDLDSDFIFLQEVDKKATRSFNINQHEIINKEFKDYDSSYASNFHSAYLAYPLNDMIGKTEAGIVTLSKYNIDSSTRISLPIDESFPTKFFDLDRCFVINRINLSNGKELVLINVHLSAYDEGGVIRKEQMKVLNKVLDDEKNKGNYVVVAGDFNHDIVNKEDEVIKEFATKQNRPSWVQYFDYEGLTSGYRVEAASNEPTCRSTDMAYVEGSNYQVVVDGFIVSDNISVISKSVSRQNDKLYLYSDHNPVTLEFKLN